MSFSNRMFFSGPRSIGVKLHAQLWASSSIRGQRAPFCVHYIYIYISYDPLCLFVLFQVCAAIVDPGPQEAWVASVVH